MTRAINITASGEVREISLATPPRLDELQTLVGGYIEAVTLRNGDTLYLNEEGKLVGLPVNFLATRLTRGVLPEYDLVVGDVVIVGGPDADGNDTDAAMQLVQPVA